MASLVRARLALPLIALSLLGFGCTKKVIRVFPEAASVPAGVRVQFSANLTSDGQPAAQLTASDATWASSDLAIATIDPSGLATTIKSGMVTFTVTYTKDPSLTGSATLTVNDAAIGSLKVMPATAKIPIGTTQAFTVMGTFTDGSSHDITKLATWASSDAMVATIDKDGVATGKIDGATTITASAPGFTGGDGGAGAMVSGTALLSVTSAALTAIEVTPALPMSPAGTTLQFTATGKYSDSSMADLTSMVTWSTSDVKIATVSNDPGKKGLVSTLIGGAVDVIATQGMVSGKSALTVSSAKLTAIAITPQNPAIPKGTTKQFKATGTFSDTTTQDLTATVVWSSSDVAVATISDPMALGLATGVAVGQVTISAEAMGVTGSTSLTVTGGKLLSIAVTPNAETIAKGTTLQLQAVGTYSDMTTQNLTSSAMWASSDMAVATVSNANGSQGLSGGVAKGTVMMTATFGGISGATSLTVSDATLTAITITPTTPAAAKGTTVPFKATGTYSDKSSQDVTASATWSSSSLVVATVSNAMGSQGLATTIAQGQTMISAAIGNVTGATTLTVSDAMLTAIAVDPTNPILAKGSSVQFTATGSYSDKSTQDLTSAVTWASADKAVATVSSAMGSRGLALAIAKGPTMISATLGNVTGGTTLTVSDATLASIAVTPSTPVLAKGTTLAFTATGTYSDKSTQDLTTFATWASSDKAVAVVSNAVASQGVAAGIAKGQTTISASVGNISGGAVLTVNDATLSSIEVTPTSPTIAKGTTLQFIATGTYSDKSTQDLTSTATWASAAMNVASVSNANGSRGLATALGAGMSDISATVGNVSGKTGLTVTLATLSTITVTPATPAIAKGTALPFVATGTYSDSSTQVLTLSVTWVSSNPNVASVSNANGSEGVATGLGKGQTEISATLGNVSGKTTLTVSDATLTSVDLSPTNPTIAKGTSLQFSATGTYSDKSTQDVTSAVSWSSSNNNIATVSNAMGSRGLATGSGPGTATITAAVGNITGATYLFVTNATLSAISITPTSPAIAKGTTVQFAATGIYSDKSTQILTGTVAWSSSAVNVATVSNAKSSEGLASGVSAGQSTISATQGGITGTTILTVTTATLTAISVDPTNPTIAKGTTVQFAATGTYSDNSTQDLTSSVTWASATPAVATVSNSLGSRGLATGIAQGAVNISATQSGVTGTTLLTVTNATLQSITVTPANPVVAKGTSVPFTATGRYSDNSTQNLTFAANWSSSANAVATVSNGGGSQGLGFAVAQGSATITATVSGVSGGTLITVTNATLSSIAVTPQNPTIAKGTTQQFLATGTYSDLSTQNLTSSATWGSSNGGVATVSNGPGSQGLTFGAGVGQSTISATLGGVTGSTNLTVTNATLVSISVDPKGASIAKNTNLQYTATGTFSDASKQDITRQATWGSSNNGAATISNNFATKGLATGAGPGDTNITAVLAGVSGTTKLTVTNASLSQIQITPVNPTAKKGGVIQFKATGVFNGGPNQDITSQVTWGSSNLGVATISNAQGSQGLASAVANGMCTLSATLFGVTGMTTMTVN
ncbi:MAG: hypothetical protein EXR72_14745 [Myxococcales bacterium]|nr:hypothetical protein [Myxococcales bacterium]